MGPHTEAETPHSEVCGPHTPQSVVRAALELPPRTSDGTVADTFAWREDNEDIVVAGSPKLAIYINTWGQVVIRGGDNEECPVCGESEINPVILINPRDVDIVIAKLRVITDEWLRQGRLR
jgi:hypothetical protein